MTSESSASFTDTSDTGPITTGNDSSPADGKSVSVEPATQDIRIPDGSEQGRFGTRVSAFRWY